LWFEYILSVLRKNNIQSNVLNKFNEKWEKKFKRNNECLLCFKRNTKRLILRITFLGSIQEFIMLHQIQGSILKFEFELSDEFKNISNLIVALNQNLGGENKNLRIKFLQIQKHK